MNQYDLEVLFGYIKNIALNQQITKKTFKSNTKELKDIEEGLLYISQSIFEFNAFAQNICKGDFDSSMPSKQNFLAGSLKELHSVLKHLTWQTQQVARGDYGQHVSFLGEFSDSFNIMVNQLQERELLLSQQTIDQKYLVEVFMSILDAHTDWILVVDKTTEEVLYNNKSNEKTESIFEHHYGQVFESPVLQKHINRTITDNRMTNLIYHNRESDTYYSISSYPMKWHSQDALVHYISDITAEQTAHESLSKIAYLDALTDAYNRHYCINEIEKLVQEQVPFCIVMVDLNDLKIANDTYGHGAGDDYICTVVDILKSQTRDADDVCRIGGDEFILLLKECPLDIAENKMEDVFDEIDSIKRDYKLSISYGITLVNTWDWENPEDLINISDEKMYAFKQHYKQHLLDSSDSMTCVQFLYSEEKDLRSELSIIHPKSECLVQIFTTNLNEADSVALAQQIQTILPNAKILGTSANVIIFDGEQYNNETSIIVEQYQHSVIHAGIIEWTNKSPEQLVTELKNVYPDALPSLIRILISGHYDDTYDFLNIYTNQLDGTAIAGGLSSGQYELMTPPFLFTTDGFVREALSYIGIVGKKIHTFTRVNTSTEIITPAFTITETNDRQLISIDNEPAPEWFHNNLGFDNTVVYKDFDDTILNDPFIRLQIVLENESGSNRVLCYDHNEAQISQYFTKLPANKKFHIGYASPSKCVSECKQICNDIQHEPVEFLFAYSCLVRKLYLNNCSNWELAPYTNINICGVFLLGEFGYRNKTASVYNSSCILMGIAENKSHITIDTSSLDELKRIEEQQETLIQFIQNKRNANISIKVSQLLDTILDHEKKSQESLFIDPTLNMYNIAKYEKDNAEKLFTKLCLIKLINAELLISYMGRTAYFAQFKMLSASIKESFATKRKLSTHLHSYGLYYDTVVIAADDEIDNHNFLNYMSELELHFKTLQYTLGIHPFIARFVMVADHPDLLKHAYSQLQLHYSSQDHFIVGSDGSDSHGSIQNEIEVINIINYAITNHKVIPYYQGIYNNETKEIDKFEALMRIEDSHGNILPPAYFLAIAKKYRLYLTLTKMMLSLVLKDFAHSNYVVTINISSLDITSEDVRACLKEEIQKFPNPESLVFEILEDECFEDATQLTEFVEHLKNYGAKVAVDDFGSGYSNLLELIKIKPDFIKVDGQIVKDIHINTDNQIIISTIASMAKQLNIDLIAEFVESLDVQNAVLTHDIKYSQGYFFSEPKPFEKIHFPLDFSSQ